MSSTTTLGYQQPREYGHPAVRRAALGEISWDAARETLTATSNIQGLRELHIAAQKAHASQRMLDDIAADGQNLQIVNDMLAQAGADDAQ